MTRQEDGLWRDLLGRGVQVLHQYGSSEYELEAALVMHVVEKMRQTERLGDVSFADLNREGLTEKIISRALSGWG